MKKVIVKYIAFSITLFLSIISFYFYHSTSQTTGSYIYPIDDAYIHLAIAKNFALNGHWSINNFGFDSASSSILYTLLLSLCIKIFGNYPQIAFLLNLTFAVATVLIFIQYFSAFYHKRELKLALLFLLPFTLLDGMVLLGMEHSLQLFLTLCLFFALKISIDEDKQKKHFYYLLLFTFLLSTTRYESIFIFIGIFLYFIFKRKPFEALLIGVASVIGPIIFGLISVQNGGYFFPNSVLLKGHIPESQNVFLQLFALIKNGILLNKSFYKWFLFPVIFIVLSYKKTDLKNSIEKEYLSIIIIIAGLLHCIFAIFEFRYENYIMMALLLVLIPKISNFLAEFEGERKQFTFKTILKFSTFLMIVLMSFYRIYFTHNALWTSSRGVFQQQVEMSKFVGEFYKNKGVALNDIGAVSYFSNAKVLDLVGLGSTEVTRFQYQNRNLSSNKFAKKEKEFISNMVSKKRCEIAIIYPEWFQDAIPENWIKVASWRREKGFGTAKETVVFYAITRKNETKLTKNLKKYIPNKNTKISFFNVKK